MGVDIPTQAALFGQGVLLGALLGLVYDVMRAARRATGCRWLAFLLDLAFWIGTTWTLFLFALVRGDGRIQVFYLVALALGGGGYLLTLSRLTMPVFLGMFRLLGRLWRLFTTPIRAAGRGAKKFSEKRKKHFQNWLAWYKINVLYNSAGDRGKERADHEGKTGGIGH